MATGYSGAHLYKKLGIKPGHTVLTFGVPDHQSEFLPGVPDDIIVHTEAGLLTCDVLLAIAH